MAASSIAEVLATAEGRRALSAASPTYFDTYYCGMRAADHRTRWLDTFEDTISQARKTGQKGRLLLLAPRDHGKTETLISAAFRRVCLNRNIRILWISESAGTAKKRVGRLSKLLQSPRTQEDWESAPQVGCGPFRQKDSEGKLPKWTETQIYVTRTLDSVDPTIEAVGCGGGITGGHFDLIFCHERGTPMLHDGAWIPVEQHPSFQGFKRDDGFQVRLWGVPFSEVVTPEHRYWARGRNHQRHDLTKRGHSSTPPAWVEARDLTEFHMIGTPIDRTVDNSFPPIPTYRPGTTEGLRGGGVVVEEVPPLFQDPEWWWALGLWWGDGHIHGTQLAWSCAHSRPDVVTRLRRLASKYGKALTHVSRPSAMSVYLWADASMSRWLRSWYRPTGKCPPPWVERLGPEYQRALLRGYLDADGYVTPKNVRLTSIGLEGLLAARRMLARQDIVATIRAGAGAGQDVIEGRTVNRRQKYDLRFHAGREALGYAPAAPQRSSRDFIEDDVLWSKVRAITPVADREFAPIKTATSTYVTAFGLSHNCDDLEDDRTTYSAAQRQKTRAWWRGTVIPMLSRGGTMVVVGTRKHHDDLYSHLKASPAWRTIEDKAILKWPERHEVTVKWDKAKQQDVIDDVVTEGESVVLWEAERDIKYLLKERYNMTSMVFAREFQHDVLDDSAAAYKMAWFEDAKARGAQMRLGDIPVLDGRSLVISTGWDLALVDDAEKAQRQDSDFVAGMTVGRDPETGDRYLLGIFHRRGMTPAAIQGAVKGQFARFGGLGTGPDNPGVRAVVVERNAFGNLHYMGLQRTTDLPLKPHMTTGRNKADPWDGVSSMGTQFEYGKWIFPYHKDDAEGRALVDILVNELWGLGKEAHDDMAMALWIAELGLRGSTFVHRLAGGSGVVEAGEDRPQGHLPAPASKKPPPNFQAMQLWGGLRGLLGGQESVYDSEYTDFEEIP